MIGDISRAENIYIVCGYTDMRKVIDGLAAIVQQNFKLDVFSESLFLFCGKRCDCIKALLWEEDGFVLLYKRLEKGNMTDAEYIAMLIAENKAAHSDMIKLKRENKALKEEKKELEKEIGKKKTEIECLKKD